jgi:hypothetical protein
LKEKIETEKKYFSIESTIKNKKYLLFILKEIKNINFDI